MCVDFCVVANGLLASWEQHLKMTWIFFPTQRIAQVADYR
jgi:hypothetical protein